MVERDGTQRFASAGQEATDDNAPNPFDRGALKPVGDSTEIAELKVLLKTYGEPSGCHARNAMSRVIDSFRDHASMVYQRFLDAKDARARTITMTVNGAKLKPWSPAKTSLKPKMVAVDKREVEMGDVTTTTFRIRAFVLPRCASWVACGARSYHVTQPAIVSGGSPICSCQRDTGSCDV